jgi:hypothetical protein
MVVLGEQGFFADGRDAREGVFGDDDIERGFVVFEAEVVGRLVGLDQLGFDQDGFEI